MMKGMINMSDETKNKFSLIDLPDVPDSVDNAVKNLSDIPTKNIGQTFGDLWYLVFGGISHAADKKRMKYATDLEKYHQELTQSIDQIPNDKRTEPSIQVTAQALENSKYCVSSELLREMFVKLISGSMNIDKKALVHPSFPEIIKQLSERDALLLKDIYSSSKPALPIVTIGIRSNDNGYNVIHSNVFISKTLNFSTYDYMLSLSSLQHANLISISYDTWINDEKSYEDLKNTSEYLQVKEILSHTNQSKPYLKKGMVQLTHLGRAFCSICVATN